MQTISEFNTSTHIQVRRVRPCCILGIGELQLVNAIVRQVIEMLHSVIMTIKHFLFTNDILRVQ